MKNVLVVFGGVSSEHDVSVVSASSVIRNIPADKYRLFLMGITMQNHGGYVGTYTNFPQEAYVTSSDKAYPKTNQYLSLIKKSDEAFQELINYFSQQDEPTIICMFGDHQPSIEDGFYKELYGKDLNSLTLEEEQRQYITPFYIWANYDIEEQEIDKLSANYLSSLLLKTAGVPMTNYNQFLLNLTSLALAPLREDIASKNDDWAKKPGIMTASGPFKLTKVGFYKNGEITYEDINYSVKVVDENNKVVLDKNGNPVYKNASEPGSFTEQRISSFILERNAYYYRNAEDDEKLDVSVTPYRIIVDCSLNDNEILEAYNDGIITYVGDIPLSLRNDVSDKATKYNSLSTNLLYLNQNAEITRKYEKDGETVTEKVKLFSDEYVKVRQALSMAIDRDAIVKKVVFAEPATGIVPTGVFDTNSADKLFRNSSSETGTNLKYNKDKAAGLLKEANVVPSEYSFSVTVAAYDEVHLAIADIVIEAWKELGFNVSLNTRGTVPNNDYHKDVAGIPTDLCDDLWAEDIKNGQYEVALLDLVATSADSMSVLAPFARQFAGERMDMSNSANYELAPHSTGYDSDDYNDLIEKIFTNQNIASRSEDLHKAEDMLMNDMPVIPLVFNQSAYLINEDVLDLNNKVLFWETSSEYYYPVCFDKMSVKDYDEYELACAKYVYDNFDEWKTRSNSYFATNFTNISKESFVYTNSNYYYLFKNKYGTANYDWIPSKP